MRSQPLCLILRRNLPRLNAVPTSTWGLGRVLGQLFMAFLTLTELPSLTTSSSKALPGCVCGLSVSFPSSSQELTETARSQPSIRWIQGLGEVDVRHFRLWTHLSKGRANGRSVACSTTSQLYFEM